MPIKKLHCDCEQCRQADEALADEAEPIADGQRFISVMFGNLEADDIAHLTERLLPALRSRLGSCCDRHRAVGDDLPRAAVVALTTEMLTDLLVLRYDLYGDVPKAYDERVGTLIDRLIGFRKEHQCF